MKCRTRITAMLAVVLVLLSPAVVAQHKDNPIGATSLAPPLDLSLLTMEIGAENTIDIGSISGGGGAGKASFKELVVTKYPDAATPELLGLLLTGTHVQDLVITQGNMQWELGLVMVSEYSSAGEAGKDGTHVETWVLQFGSMRVLVDGAEFCWDRVYNSACN